MKILITGSSGLLGSNLCYLFAKDGHNVIGTYRSKTFNIPNVQYIEIGKIYSSEIQVDFVIHCAAMTNVDECERNPSFAYENNIVLTEKLIKFAKDKGAYFIHISTDAVYQDSNDKKNEHSPIKPTSVYAITKLKAEEVVLGSGVNSSVIRTNMFGFNILNKYSLSEWIYHNISNKMHINCFNDVSFSPILVNDLKDAISIIVTSYDKRHLGVVNIGSATSMTKYEFAVTLANVFDLDPAYINPISIDDFNFAAKRNKNSILDCSMFEHVFNYKLSTLTESIFKYKRLFDSDYPKLLKSFNA